MDALRETDHDDFFEWQFEHVTVYAHKSVLKADCEELARRAKEAREDDIKMRWILGVPKATRILDGKTGAVLWEAATPA